MQKDAEIRAAKADLHEVYQMQNVSLHYQKEKMLPGLSPLKEEEIRLV